MIAELQNRGLGTSAAMALRAWWVGRNVHNARDALRELTRMALTVREEAPEAQFAYIQPRTQEAVIHESASNDLVLGDLLRPPAAAVIEVADVSGPERSARRERLLQALQHSLAIRDMITTESLPSTRASGVLEALIWLAAEPDSALDLLDMMRRGGAGTTSCDQMIAWWRERDVNTAEGAQVYLQGVSVSDAPLGVYEGLSLAVQEDVVTAAAPEDLFIQELFPQLAVGGPSQASVGGCPPEAHGDPSVDAQAAGRTRDRLLNPSAWDDVEAW